MADLKAGTTIGGTLVWTQGNFPLYPTGDTLLYKTYKIYSEKDKPQAIDNDFVSKANGGTYIGNIGAPALGITGSSGITGKGLSLYNGVTNGEPEYGIHFSRTNTFGTHGNNTQDWATYFTHRGGVYPWIFRGVLNGVVTNLASVSSSGVWQGPDVIIQNSPTFAAHATRKDYVDNQINIVTINANSRVLRSGDSMTGPLTAPNIISNNAATSAAHVPRLDQVVQRGVILDFGTF
ncbi:hinge connector of long tail fiber [Acinetobacter phage vB_AbaM_PhT2]|uniref:Hinge connector of long tail fiber n=1 Tax=Acinetobacter phage vB_AbaM_PhT2 TaxID=2690230 RepID=A0A6B9T0J4_9CAUD|nr:hinge connector of long tail fiber protein distal connector [Acinetobacter phage vB_AbaM_PhT2]QHJ75703.1 hinge connector of long tail fiber [Acinetobacter phage vB_AbaM_PhT2]